MSTWNNPKYHESLGKHNQNPNETISYSLEGNHKKNTPEAGSQPSTWDAGEGISIWYWQLLWGLDLVPVSGSWLQLSAKADPGYLSGPGPGDKKQDAGSQVWENFVAQGGTDFQQMKGFWSWVAAAKAQQCPHTLELCVKNGGDGKVHVLCVLPQWQ